MLLVLWSVCLGLRCAPLKVLAISTTIGFLFCELCFAQVRLAYLYSLKASIPVRLRFLRDMLDDKVLVVALIRAFFGRAWASVCLPMVNDWMEEG
jgi:hypothetical protein